MTVIRGHIQIHKICQYYQHNEITTAVNGARITTDGVYIIVKLIEGV